MLRKLGNWEIGRLGDEETGRLGDWHADETGPLSRSVDGYRFFGTQIEEI